MRGVKRLICAASVMAIMAGDAISQVAPEAKAPTTTTMTATMPAIASATDPATQPATQPAAQMTTAPSTDAAVPEMARPFVAPKPAPESALASGHPSTTQISFDFENASVDAVLQHLSDVAGFIVLKDTGIGPISGRVTVLSKQPVTPDEAVTLLNTVLKNSGYTAIRMGRILKIVAFDKAKKSDLPVHFGADPEAIEPTDDLVTWVIPVRSVDAVKLKADLAPLIPTDADVSSNAGSNTIIMTDTQANIRRVVEIIAAMDKRDATQNTIRVKQLKYADATAAAKLINDIFNPTTSGQAQQNFGAGALFRAFGGRGGGGGGGGFGGGFGGRGGGGGEAAQTEEQGNTGKVIASSDARTNTVVVTGPEDTLTVIDTVLTQLDANPAAEASFFIYRVKNGQSADMAATLNALFSDTGTTGTTGSSTSAAARSGVTSTGNRNSSGFGGSGGSSGSLGNNSSSAITRSFNGGGTGTTGGGIGGGNRGGGIGGTNGSSAQTSALADLQGQVNVVADVDTNSLLVACAAKYQDEVKAVIDELDRPVQQVLIKALIASVTHDNSDDLGLDFSVLNLRPSGNGQSLVSNLGNAAENATNGGLAVSVLEKNLSATFHALASQGKIDVLSRPYILASDNQEAVITVGQEVPFITNSQTTDLGNIINTIQYQTLGIILDVTPHLNPDGLVILDVSPQISSLSDGSVEIQNGVFSPEFNNTSASSRVGIRDGDTIVIGGLMQDQLTQTITKVPLLGDIPYVGPILFGQSNTVKTKEELLIFLTPHVAPVPGKLEAMSRDEMRGIKLTPNAVEPGTFQDHLRGMRLGGSTTAPSLLDLTQPTAPPGSSLEPSLPGDHIAPGNAANPPVDHPQTPGG
jgi:general secretion pathway protein D